MGREVIERYLDSAVHFTAASAARLDVKTIRVASTLATCGLAVAVLNELALPEESETAYHAVNIHNPLCPLSFDRAATQWTCAAGLEVHPVWGINWRGAVLICEHLGARLPLAAEWEAFASNNQPERVYPWGDADPNFSLANYDEYYGGTTPVGSFPPSDLGLYDLAGNLSEWCLDHFALAAGRGTSFERVVKGGAWSKEARFLQIAVNRGKWERLGTTTIGFRPVWDDA
jgi:formylglycine-generating enzyme required for sulfatase activity